MPFPPAPTLIVFDKDGVLLDLNATWLPLIIGITEYLSERADGAVERDALLAAVGVEMEPGSDNGRILENSVFAAGTFVAMREIWEEMAPVLAPVFADLETYRADVQRIREEKVRGRTAAKGDVAAALAELRAAGWALAVATNDTVNSTQVNLEDMGIADAFDAVICADSGFGRKPEAGGLLEACRVAGCAPEEAIMVGDTQTDWLAAQKAGFGGFVAVADNAPELPGFIPSADLVLPDIAELADHLNGHQR
ncbi:MAG: HAD family hydrolase [Candidatus Puniceispirillales bacterium]